MNNTLRGFRHLELRKDCVDIELVEWPDRKRTGGSTPCEESRHYLWGADHSISSTLSFAIQQ